VAAWLAQANAQSLPTIAPTFAATQAEDELLKATDFAGFSRVPTFQQKRIARPLIEKNFRPHLITIRRKIRACERWLPMNPFAAGQIFKRVNRSDHRQQEKLGLFPQQNVSTSRISAVDDHTRFANIVLPHLDDAYTSAVWLTGNRADAEDVVQDACLQAFRAIKSFAGSNARAWILTIVRHSAYAWLRKNRPAALVIVEETEAVEPAQSAAWAPEAALITKTDAARLETAIAALPIPFRETVVLREVHGLSYHEIAKVTKVPIGTVMSRLARGRYRLIAAIEKKTPTELHHGHAEYHRPTICRDGDARRSNDRYTDGDFRHAGPDQPRLALSRQNRGARASELSTKIK
jgi:RNA polymerase sigma factor (sigma-70 family)